MENLIPALGGCLEEKANSYEWLPTPGILDTSLDAYVERSYNHLISMVQENIAGNTCEHYVTEMYLAAEAAGFVRSNIRHFLRLPPANTRGRPRVDYLLGDENGDTKIELTQKFNTKNCAGLVAVRGGILFCIGETGDRKIRKPVEGGILAKLGRRSFSTMLFGVPEGFDGWFAIERNAKVRSSVDATVRDYRPEIRKRLYEHGLSVGLTHA